MRALIVALAVATAACGEQKAMVAIEVEEQHQRPLNPQNLHRVPTEADALADELRAIAATKVWFGHHSVGQDMLDGVRALAREAGVEVAIGEGPVGENGKPLEKIADFEREAIASGADVVAMKLCYADFTPTTDVRAVLDAYEAAVQRVRAARPGIRVVHITPPLTVRPTDVKSRVQRLLGQPVWGDASNLRRLELAEGMAARFPDEPLVDLGLLQSTRSDGSREVHLVEGPSVPGGRARLVPMLWEGWARDEGHLNDDGKRMAGRAFVRVLAEATRTVIAQAR